MQHPRSQTDLSDPEWETDEDHVSFSDLMGLVLTFNSRLDALWQRVLYAHAAIVGVMVFFGTSDHMFAVPRMLVFFFYTLNTMITVFAFLETYSGLRATIADLKNYPKSASSGNLQNWILNRHYSSHATRRVCALITIWLVLGYLLIYPLFVTSS